MKENIALADFVHIGLSMPLRAYDNPDIDTGAVLRWVRRHMAEDFGWYGKNPYLRPRWLLRQGIKGMGIFAALVCHRLNCFALFLWLYKTVTRTLKIDIKF